MMTTPPTSINNNSPGFVSTIGNSNSKQAGMSTHTALIANSNTLATTIPVSHHAETPTDTDTDTATAFTHEKLVLVSNNANSNNTLATTIPVSHHAETPTDTDTDTATATAFTHEKLVLVSTNANSNNTLATTIPVSHHGETPTDTASTNNCPNIPVLGSVTITHTEKSKEIKVKMPCLAVIIQNHPEYKSLIDVPDNEVYRIVGRIVKEMLQEYSGCGVPSVVRIAWKVGGIKVDDDKWPMVPVLVVFEKNYSTKNTPFRISFSYNNVQVSTSMIDLSTHPEADFASFSPLVTDYGYDSNKEEIFELSSPKKVVKYKYKKPSSLEKLIKNSTNEESIRTETSATKSEAQTQNSSTKKMDRMQLKRERKLYKDRSEDLEKQNNILIAKKEEFIFVNAQLNKDTHDLNHELKKAKKTPREVFKRENDKENPQCLGESNSALSQTNIRL